MKHFLQKVLGNAEPFLPYASALILPTIALFAAIAVSSLTREITPILFFLPTIVVTAWYGGIKPGALSTTVSSVCLTTYLFYLQDFSSIPQIPTLTQVCLLLAEGYLISIAIESYKHTSQQAVYRKKEKEYQTYIAHLEKEKEKTQGEVKARDEFLSIASHELRTPLTSMLLQLQTALNNIQNVSLANFSVANLLNMLESAEQQSQRLTRMINDLLNVSLITTGRLDLEIEETDLVVIVKDVINRFAEKLDREKITLELEAEEKVLLFCDKLRIEQVITNLISNAIKYGNGKPIHGIVGKHNSTGVVVIKDSGIGIPKDKQKLIFARFERAVSSQNYKGLGVGLYIAEHIIHAHGGTISLSSSPAKGSTFTIRLPLDRPKY